MLLALLIAVVSLVPGRAELRSTHVRAHTRTEAVVSVLHVPQEKEKSKSNEDPELGVLGWIGALVGFVLLYGLGGGVVLAIVLLVHAWRTDSRERRARRPPVEPATPGSPSPKRLE